MSKTVVAMLLVASVGISMPAFAADPSLHEVYQAAQSGQMAEAQRMMQEVLLAHPNSAKAHYVEAELLAKEGKLKQAANELASAEKLAPGLPFATPQAVSSLRESVSSGASKSPVAASHSPLAVQSGRDGQGFPWGMVLMGLGLVAFIVGVSKFMSRRSGPSAPAPSPAGFGGYPPPYPAGPYGGATQGIGGPGAMPAPTPGLGSQVLGGLATGAAVGAGVVAGEALMHHFMDSNKAAPTSDRIISDLEPIPQVPSFPGNDLGGKDFGISGDSSWDDGGAGDSDWS